MFQAKVMLLASCGVPSMGPATLQPTGPKRLPERWRGLISRKGASSPCAIYHAGRRIKAVVRGDNLLCEAQLERLRWLQSELCKAFTIKSKILGPDEGCVSEVKLLNRQIRWEKEGISWEADRRHVDVLFEQIGMDRSKTGSVCTPFVKEGKNVSDRLGDVGVDLIDVFQGGSLKQDGARVASPAGADQGKHMLMSQAYSRGCEGLNLWQGHWFELL